MGLANESDTDFYELLGKTKALGSTQWESWNSFLWGHQLRTWASHSPPLRFSFISPEGDVAQSTKPTAPLQPTPQKENLLTMLTLHTTNGDKSKCF